MKNSEYSYNNMTDARAARIAARQERKDPSNDPDVIKANALLAIAAKPASGGSKALIIIPIAVILLGGIVAIIMLKKKK